MDQTEQVQRWLRSQKNVRVGTHTAEYAARQLAAEVGAFYVIGGDARTGRPVRLMVESSQEVSGVVANQ